jgi:hypothetical protein
VWQEIHIHIMKQKLFTRATLSSIALVLCFSPGASRAQSNLVANGSFEAGPLGQEKFTDWNSLGPASDNSNYGVTNSTSPPDVAEQGTNYAYFRGHPTDSSQDCLGTSFTLKLGALYNISYYLGTDGAIGNGAAMWVVIGPSFGIDLSQDIMLTAFLPNSSSALPYQQFSTIYLATNTSPILSFHGINATNGISATSAILLDNVSVVLAYPQLSLNFSPPGSLVFTWPFTNSPYRLQSADSLTSSNWVTLTNVPVNIGTNSQVILSASANMQFFRLTLP